MIQIRKEDLEELEQIVNEKKGAPILTYQDECGKPLGCFLPEYLGLGHYDWDNSISPVDLMLTRLGLIASVDFDRKYIRQRIKSSKDSTNEDYYLSVVEGATKTIQDHLKPNEDFADIDKGELAEMMEKIQWYYKIIERWALAED